MISKIWVALVCVLVAAFINQAVAGPIANGGFETGTSFGWQPADDGDAGNVNSTIWALRVTTETAHSGNYSRLIHHDGQANSYHEFAQPVDLFGQHTLRFWLNVDLNPNGPEGSEDTGSWAGAELRDSAGGGLVDLVTIGGIDPGHYGTDGWQQYEVDLTNLVISGPADWSLVFWLETWHNRNSANQRIYVDDVELIPEPASLGLLLLGGLALLRRSRGYSGRS